MLSASDDRYERIRSRLGPRPGILTSSETAPNSPLWLNTNAATIEALRIGGCCIRARSNSMRLFPDLPRSPAPSNVPNHGLPTLVDMKVFDRVAQRKQPRRRCLQA